MQVAGCGQSLAERAEDYVCKHVFEGSRPVLLVSRGDGDWCFLCGGHHEDRASEYRVIGIGHVVESDKTLGDLFDLPADWEAERQSVDSRWIRARYDPLKD
jgi:hypothetical protein